MSAVDAARSELRLRLREQRRTVVGAAAEQCGLDVLEKLRSLPEAEVARTVAVYLATDGEVDAAPTIDWLKARDVEVCAPRLVAGEMEFGNLTARLQVGQLGISEPVGETVAIERIDLVIVPLVAIDERGTRVGRGAGYYDRTFSGLLAADRPSRPWLVGYGHDFQLVPTLERQAHDVPLDALVTPTQVRRFEA